MSDAGNSITMPSHSGSKYIRDIQDVLGDKTIQVDVYNVIDAYGVTCPAIQHAIKKLLCAGIRGKNNTDGDLREARDAISRAITLNQSKQSKPKEF